ncbi:MAG: hypothetical protein M1831_007202 [Alyxoria varia]|nr:MAG: hypothetical protein M1831_007202 [Alyxoria varia]
MYTRTLTLLPAITSILAASVSSIPFAESRQAPGSNSGDQIPYPGYPSEGDAICVTDPVRAANGSDIKFLLQLLYDDSDHVYTGDTAGKCNVVTTHRGARASICAPEGALTFLPGASFHAFILIDAILKLVDGSKGVCAGGRAGYGQNWNSGFDRTENVNASGNFDETDVGKDPLGGFVALTIDDVNNATDRESPYRLLLDNPKAPTSPL